MSEIKHLEAKYADKLRVIAEGMGYIIIDTHAANFPDSVFIETSLGDDVYDPITNNDQMVEIMERLKIDVEHHGDKIKAWVNIKDSNRAFWGKTINEAVCNAAYEYLKNK